MNTITMDATSTYNHSLLMQAVSLPDLLRPIFLDESTQHATSKLGELVTEMKSIANVTQSLVKRVKKISSISINAETQAKLQESIADAKDLSIKIENTSKQIRGVKFSITWKAEKIIKSAKKTKRNVEKIEELLSPYFDADPYLIGMISAKSTLPVSTSTFLTQGDLDYLDTPEAEEHAASGLKKLVSDARVIH